MGWIDGIKSFFSGAPDSAEEEALAKAYKKVVTVKPSAITEPIVNITLKASELAKLSKKKLDVHALEVHGIQLDGRLTKDKMLAQFKKELKKKK